MPNLRKLFAETAHRQYPMPDRPWKYYQEWDHVLMLHWKVPASAIASQLPKGLLLDQFEGEAWVSMVLFSVNNLQLRRLPALPYLNSFHEVNLRTYVIKDGKPGIYFLSIEADRLPIVLLTRLFTGIPYVKSEMEVGKNYFSSRSKNYGLHVEINYKANEIIGAKTDLEYWLTERHCLYCKEGNSLYRYNVHHREWKLRNVALAIHNIKYKAGPYTIETEPILKHYSRKLGTIFWGRELVTDSNL